jgi:hypothetical protein
MRIRRSRRSRILKRTQKGSENAKRLVAPTNAGTAQCGTATPGLFLELQMPLRKQRGKTLRPNLQNDTINIELAIEEGPHPSRDIGHLHN